MNILPNNHQLWNSHYNLVIHQNQQVLQMANHLMLQLKNLKILVSLRVRILLYRLTYHHRINHLLIRMVSQVILFILVVLGLSQPLWPMTPMLVLVINHGTYSLERHSGLST